MSLDSLDVYTVRIILKYICDIRTFDYISHVFKRVHPQFALEARKRVKPTKVYLLWQYGSGKCDFPWFESLCFSTSLDHIEGYYGHVLETQPYISKFDKSLVEKYSSQTSDFEIINEFRRKYYSENPLGDWETVDKYSKEQNSDVLKQVFSDLRNNRSGDYYNGSRRAGARWGYEIYTRVEVLYLYLNDPECQVLHAVFKQDHNSDHHSEYNGKLLACVETRQMIHDKFQHVLGNQINTLMLQGHKHIYCCDNNNPRDENSDYYEMHTFNRLN